MFAPAAVPAPAIVQEAAGQIDDELDALRTEIALLRDKLAVTKNGRTQAEAAAAELVEAELQAKLHRDELRHVERARSLAEEARRQIERDYADRVRTDQEQARVAERTLRVAELDARSAALDAQRADLEAHAAQAMEHAIAGRRTSQEALNTQLHELQQHLSGLANVAGSAEGNDQLKEARVLLDALRTAGDAADGLVFDLRSVEADAPVVITTTGGSGDRMLFPRGTTTVTSMNGFDGDRSFSIQIVGDAEGLSSEQLQKVLAEIDAKAEGLVIGGGVADDSETATVEVRTTAPAKRYASLKSVGGQAGLSKEGSARYSFRIGDDEPQVFVFEGGDGDGREILELKKRIAGEATGAGKGRYVVRSGGQPGGPIVKFDGDGAGQSEDVRVIYEALVGGQPDGDEPKHHVFHVEGDGGAYKWLGTDGPHGVEFDLDFDFEGGGEHDIHVFKHGVDLHETGGDPVELQVEALLGELRKADPNSAGGVNLFKHKGGSGSIWMQKGHADPVEVEVEVHADGPQSLFGKAKKLHVDVQGHAHPLDKAKPLWVESSKHHPNSQGGHLDSGRIVIRGEGSSNLQVHNHVHSETGGQGHGELHNLLSEMHAELKAIREELADLKRRMGDS